MKRFKKRSVFYVNYSPYENAGSILDFLLENFEYVYLFSLSFHPLGKKQKTNRLLIYKNKKVIKKVFMGNVSVPSSLVFLLLPLRSAINLIQLFWNVLKIKFEYSKIDVFFSVNAYTSWLGIILKEMGLVGRTLFWVWDFYPLVHKNKVILFMRWIYWQFDKLATKSDRVVCLNNKLVKVRKNIGLLPKNTRYPIVPIGTDIKYSKVRKKKKNIKIGFVGVLKKTQGLDLLFDNASILVKKFPNISYEIIGSGPDREYFQKRAKNVEIKTNFYGYVEESEFRKILSRCTIGLAPYVPGDDNLSTYGDPGKVKKYLSFGLPVITTNVFEFSKELEKEKAGIVIDYYNPNTLVEAIRRITKSHSLYSKRAVKLNKKYYYKDIYPKLFI